jgi:hypothetical protein
MPILGTVASGFTAPPTLEYLIVAGGGAGSIGDVYGAYGSGGGGAGGVIYEPSFSFVLGTTYTITIGGGGTMTIGALATTTSGNNTTMTGQPTAIGGGKGGMAVNYREQGQTGSNGGSGGGGAGPSGSRVGGSGTVGPPRQGYNGGSGSIEYYSVDNDLYYSNGGGGGGAGSAGSDGGSGLFSHGNGGSPVTYIGSTVGAGGKNGTGQGAANTGNGGGGQQTNNSGNGGSGLVKIRTLDSIATASYTGAPSFVNSGGYKTYTFTANGSITF